jgi:hypothetical protein
MAVEDLVDDFWREALILNLDGPQAEQSGTHSFSDSGIGSPVFPKRRRTRSFGGLQRAMQSAPRSRAKALTS